MPMSVTARALNRADAAANLAEPAFGLGQRMNT